MIKCKKLIKITCTPFDYHFLFFLFIFLVEIKIDNPSVLIVNKRNVLFYSKEVLYSVLLVTEIIKLTTEN